jgi:hypothetical protein
MTVVRVAEGVVAEMIRDGRIRDESSVAAYGMLLLHHNAAPSE